MYAVSNYTFHFEGSEDAIKKASAFISDVFYGDESLIGEKEIEVENIDMDYVYVEEISELAAELVKESPDVEFTISGTVDTSESAGEYMDFLIAYKKGELTAQDSGWYVILCASDYETYEDFCEEYRNEDDKPLYTEEEYNQFFEGEWFVLESGSGSIVNCVPLGEKECIDISDEE